MAMLLAHHLETTRTAQSNAKLKVQEMFGDQSEADNVDSLFSTGVLARLFVCFVPVYLFVHKNVSDSE